MRYALCKVGCTCNYFLLFYLSLKCCWDEDKERVCVCVSPCFIPGNDYPCFLAEQFHPFKWEALRNIKTNEWYITISHIFLLLLSFCYGCNDYSRHSASLLLSQRKHHPFKITTGICESIYFSFVEKSKPKTAEVLKHTPDTDLVMQVCSL